MRQRSCIDEDERREKVRTVKTDPRMHAISWIEEFDRVNTDKWRRRNMKKWRKKERAQRELGRAECRSSKASPLA